MISVNNTCNNLSESQENINLQAVNVIDSNISVIKTYHVQLKSYFYFYILYDWFKAKIRYGVYKVSTFINIYFLLYLSILKYIAYNSIFQFSQIFAPTNNIWMEAVVRFWKADIIVYVLTAISETNVSMQLIFITYSVSSQRQILFYNR